MSPFSLGYAPDIKISVSMDESRSARNMYTLNAKVYANHKTMCFIFTDLDECQTSANTCRHRCKNIIGKFMCLCPDGYTAVNGNGNICLGKYENSSSQSEDIIVSVIASNQCHLVVIVHPI